MKEMFCLWLYGVLLIWFYEWSKPRADKLIAKLRRYLGE